MVWNVVLKIVIWGIWGCVFWINLILVKFVGLCKGVKIERLLIFCMIFLLIRIGVWNLFFFWIIWCFIVLIWLKFLIIFIFVKFLWIIKSLFVWFLIINFFFNFWLLWCKCDLIFNCFISLLIFLVKLFVKGLFFFMLNNLNLIDELFRFNIKIFINSF